MEKPCICLKFEESVDIPDVITYLEGLSSVVAVKDEDPYWYLIREEGLTFTFLPEGNVGNDEYEPQVSEPFIYCSKFRIREEEMKDILTFLRDVQKFVSGKAEILLSAKYD